MRTRRVTVKALAAALLGAVALGTSAASHATTLHLEPDHEIVRYVTPGHVAAHDVSYVLAPNSDRTFRLALPELRRPGAVLVPCWGFDLVGPGIDLAAASLKPFGWVTEADPRYRNPRAVRREDGWYLPESDAVVDLRQMADGAACRTVGWSTFVEAGDGVASAAEVRRARRQNRVVRIRHPRVGPKGGSRANRYNDGTTTVPLAGLERRPRSRVSEVVVRVVTGPLAGPTTITLHGRVVVPR